MSRSTDFSYISVQDGLPEEDMVVDFILHGIGVVHTGQFSGGGFHDETLDRKYSSEEVDMWKPVTIGSTWLKDANTPALMRLIRMQAILIEQLQEQVMVLKEPQLYE